MTKGGFDRAIEYVKLLEKFRAKFEAADPGCVQHGHKIRVETGRKFDKVYIQTYHNGTPHQRLGRYMVDRNSWAIYGIKSWQQVNLRRVYGTLDTMDEWNWQPFYATPIAGTPSEKQHLKRESEIAKNFRPRGRPRKTKRVK